MRTIPIPVDAAKLVFTCVKAPHPRVLNRDTGELKLDKTGQAIYETVLSVEDDFGRIELVKIGTSGDPGVTAGSEVTPIDMIGYVWETSGRWGISYRAASFQPAHAAPVDDDRA
ncbi:hypothetical protein Acor_72040 [Acrocarpospora corrugata]|uniref:Regulatory protein n=1 Tax=Acrocarpospora corrugata TaxID=35763 RepID=A0A5M3W8I1_9ACTN|nr:hypothetical protein [Acrocarpospora corrugata]GES05136.1 hypothetical protein Acor_72040 [Acrocarpospora corrugata]